MGLKSYGHNVLISRKVSIYGAENISIGHDVRIDDFCILSGKITLGSYVHIAAYTALFAGNAGISIGNFSSLSSRCAVYSLSDDFSGKTLVNSVVPDEYKHVVREEVIIGDYVNIGTSCTVLPGVHIPEGCAVWAMSMVTKSLKEWGVYFGIPCKRIIDRDRNMRSLGEELLSKDSSSQSEQ